jgi:hypothetical protein
LPSGQVGTQAKGAGPRCKCLKISAKKVHFLHFRLETAKPGLAAADSFDGTILDCHQARTEEDQNFEVFQLVLARCAPERLGNIVRAKLRQTPVPADARYWRALHAAEHFILGGPQESTAAGALRRSSHEEDGPSETYASNQLLLLELKREAAFRQIEILMEAGLESIFLEVIHLLKPLTSAEGEALVARFCDGSVAQTENLICLLWATRVEMTEAVWTWLLEVVDGPEAELHGVAFRTLTAADGARFGCDLLARDWSWSPSRGHRENHYGTEALIKATVARPFDQVASRLAPWRLLEAARERGADPSEVRLPAALLTAVLGADNLEAPDVGAQLSLDCTGNRPWPGGISITTSDPLPDVADPSSNTRRLLHPMERLTQVSQFLTENAGSQLF